MQDKKHIFVLLVGIFCALVGLFVWNKIYVFKMSKFLEFKIVEVKFVDINDGYLDTLKRTKKFANDVRRLPEKKFSDDEIEKIFSNLVNMRILEITYEIYNNSKDKSFNEIYFTPNFHGELNKSIWGFSTFFSYDKTDWPIRPTEIRKYNQHLLVDLNGKDDKKFIEMLKDETIKVQYREDKQKNNPFGNFFWIEKLINIDL